MLGLLLIRNRRKQRMHKQGTFLVQAAKFLGIEQSALYMALQKGQIPTSTSGVQIKHPFKINEKLTLYS